MNYRVYNNSVFIQQTKEGWLIVIQLELFYSAKLLKITENVVLFCLEFILPLLVYSFKLIIGDPKRPLP